MRKVRVGIRTRVRVTVRITVRVKVTVGGVRVWVGLGSGKGFVLGQELGLG